MSFTAVTSYYTSVSFKVSMYVLIGLGSLTAYNFVKYAKIAKLYHRSLTTNLRTIQVLSLTAFIAFIWQLLLLTINEVILLALVGFLTLAYAVPLASQKPNLRTIKGLKIFIIAIVWTLITVLLPLITSSIGFTELMILSFHRMLWVLVLLVPFEIRDLNYDPEELSTLPQLLGVKTTKLIGFALLVIQYFVGYWFFDFGLVEAFISLITGLLLLFSYRQQRVFYSSIGVEAIPILWFMAIKLT